MKIRKLHWYEKFLIWLDSDPLDPEDYERKLSKYCYEKFYKPLKGGDRL